VELEDEKIVDLKHEEPVPSTPESPEPIPEPRVITNKKTATSVLDVEH
jgi:hypothetical protein